MRLMCEHRVAARPVRLEATERQDVRLDLCRPCEQSLRLGNQVTAYEQNGTRQGQPVPIRYVP